MKELTSERLKLRQITDDDFEIMRHLDIDPVVKKYLGPPSPESDTYKRMDKIKRLRNEGSPLGYWMGEIKASGEPIGWFVLNHVQETEYIEIGYRLLEKHWSNGYATEGSQVLLNHGFSDLNLDLIIGITHQENEPSKHVLKKIGLIEKGIRHFYDMDVCYFELDKEDYSLSIVK